MSIIRAGLCLLLLPLATMARITRQPNAAGCTSASRYWKPPSGRGDELGTREELAKAKEEFKAKACSQYDY